MQSGFRFPFSRPILVLSLLLLALPTATSANECATPSSPRSIVDTFTMWGISPSTRFTGMVSRTIATYQLIGPILRIYETTTITEIGGFVNNCRGNYLPGCTNTSPLVVQIRPAAPVWDPAYGEVPDLNIVLATFTLSHDNDPLYFSYESAQVNLTLQPGIYFALFAPGDPNDQGFLLDTAAVPGFKASTVQLGVVDLETGRSFAPGYLPAAVRIRGHCTPDTLAVTLDVKPGSFPNVINPKSRGVIQVAVVATAGFDPTRIDLETLAFGPSGAEPSQAIFKDINADGLTDLRLHFRTEETGLTCADTSATLTGRTADGQSIKGTDTIRTVGCK